MIDDCMDDFMTEYDKNELREKCIAGLTDEDWELIATALFDKQCTLREECSQRNCGDKEWSLVDRFYGLYMTIATFITQ